MFLNVLSEHEKEVFLELAVQLANSDLDFSREEVSLINQYRIEMNLPENAYQIRGLPLVECINLLSKSTSQVKNIIYFELLGLSLCDEIFENSEAGYLDNVRNSINIEAEKANEMRDCINSLTVLYKKIGILLK